MVERWLPIDGFDGYEVSDLGAVRCWFGKGKPVSTRLDQPELLTQSVSSYAQVWLWRDGKKHARHVHVLVLTAHVGPRPDGAEGCHFPDKSTRNNALINLRWATKKENGADRQVHKAEEDGVYDRQLAEIHAARMAGGCL